MVLRSGVSAVTVNVAPHFLHLARLPTADSSKRYFAPHVHRTFGIVMFSLPLGLRPAHFGQDRMLNEKR